MKSFYYLFFTLILTTPFQVHAQCTMPHGQPNAEMGVLIFNKAHKVMQYCNGDDWIGLWGGGSGGGGTGSVQRVSGEVVAFDLTSCPEGWSEYLPARGRFIRGIDGGAGNDPDGVRSPGHIQADELKAHSHRVHRNISGGQTRDVFYFFDEYKGNGSTLPTTETGGPETRPKNVALLYCRKN